MNEIIRITILNNSSIYNIYRQEHDHVIQILDRNLKRIEMSNNLKRSAKRELIVENTRERMQMLALILKQTILHYQSMYYESDIYRGLKLYQL